jgi:lipopolysaccharide export system permease protein
MSVLRRYVSYRFIFYFALVLSAMSALALTLDLMEEADKVLRSAPDGTVALLRYSGLRLPDIAAQMLPMAALLGMLFTLGQFMRHRELVALWSSGVSPMGLIFAMLPVAVALAAVDFANNDVAVPETQSALRSLGFASERKSASASEKSEAEWLLSGSDVVRLPKQPATDGVLRHISIFRRDADGRLTERIDAESATPQGDGWMLSGVTRYLIEPATTSKLASLYLDGRIDLAALPLIASDMRELGSRELIHLIEHEGYGQRPADRFRTWLHARIGSAFAPGLMMFLAISLAQRFRRTGSFGPLMLFSIGIGFAYFVLDGICLTMGETDFLPPWFAGWGPKAALASLIASFVTYGEG